MFVDSCLWVMLKKPFFAPRDAVGKNGFFVWCDWVPQKIGGYALGGQRSRAFRRERLDTLHFE